MKLKKSLRLVVPNLMAFLASAIMLAPPLLLLLNSFKPGAEAAVMNLSLPSRIEWSNFIEVINRGNLLRTFINSTMYSVVSVCLTVLLASMAAYVFARNRKKLHVFLYFFLVLGITMPINFVTLVRVMQVLSLMNSRGGIILLYTALQMPFNVFLIHSFIGKIPRDIDEAGIIDGCTPIRLYLYVILPLLKPVLITVMILTFLGTWNEFIIPLYMLGSSDLWPMTLAVFNFFGMFFTDWNLISANIVLTSLPVVIVYLCGQKYIVAGMTQGSVKG